MMMPPYLQYPSGCIQFYGNKKAAPFGAAFLLHIRFHGSDQNIRRHYPVFCRETLGKIVGVEDLCIGREFIVAFPDQNPHLIAADEIELETGIAPLRDMAESTQRDIQIANVENEI